MADFHNSFTVVFPRNVQVQTNKLSDVFAKFILLHFAR